MLWFGQIYCNLRSLLEYVLLCYCILQMGFAGIAVGAAMVCRVFLCIKLINT